MRIDKPTIIERDGQAVLQARVSSRLGDELLSYAVSVDEADALAGDTADAFVMGLLPVAMALGEDLKSEHPVSKTLLFNLNHGYIELLKTMIPRLSKVQVLAEGTEVFERSDSKVATGISGGVDSSHVITEFHMMENVPKSLRVQQLLFFNVGSHGRITDKRTQEMFEGRLLGIRKMAEMVGLPLLTVDSNLSHFHSQVGFNHMATCTARNVSAAMSVQSRVSRYLVASGGPWYRCFFGETRIMEDTDPFSLPLSKTERFDAMAVGGELTKHEKVERIADQEFAQQLLNPCTKSVRNCGKCGKCFHAQLALEIIGKLDKFHNTFDPAIWEQNRGRLVARMNMRRRRTRVEVTGFADKHNYNLHASLGDYAWYMSSTIQSEVRKRFRSTGHAVKRSLVRA